MKSKTSMIGILIPSITVIICVTGYGDYFSGSLSLGITPIISSLVVMISIGTVVKRKNRIAVEYLKEVEKKG